MIGQMAKYIIPSVYSGNGAPMETKSSSSDSMLLVSVTARTLHVKSK